MFTIQYKYHCCLDTVHFQHTAFIIKDSKSALWSSAANYTMISNMPKELFAWACGQQI